MKIAKKFLNICITIITILVIVLNLYFLYKKLIKKENVISFCGYSAFIVISGSMEPTINVNDLIIIKKEKEYKEQDIVTYKSNQSVITHRIIKKEGNIIWTKGDNNNVEDTPIEETQVYGKKIYKIKNVGKVLTIINSPIGITVFFVIIYFSIYRMWGTKERR